MLLRVVGSCCAKFETGQTFRYVQTDATTPNNAACMLRLFVRPVACCCVLLGVVAQSLKPVKLLDTSKRTQQLPTMLRPFARDL